MARLSAKNLLQSNHVTQTRPGTAAAGCQFRNYLSKTHKLLDARLLRRVERVDLLLRELQDLNEHLLSVS